MNHNNNQEDRLKGETVTHILEVTSSCLIELKTHLLRIHVLILSN